jgi:hypothetical protein
MSGVGRATRIAIVKSSMEPTTMSNETLQDLAYELRKAELELENKIAAERLQMAINSRSMRRLEVPLGGLFADQGSLFED